MQPHWMQKTVLITFIQDPHPVIPRKKSWHLTQNVKRRPKPLTHTGFAAILCSNTSEYSPSVIGEFYTVFFCFQFQTADLLPLQRLK